MNNSYNHTIPKADLLFQNAFAAHSKGRLLEAEQLYKKALRKAPRDLDTLYLLGTVCAQLGKLNDASKFLRVALDISPDHVETLNSMGLTLRGQRKLKEATSCFQRAVELKPDYVDALSNLGSVLEMDGKPEEAEIALRRALALNPAMANVHYNLGLALLAKDKFEEAARHFVRGLELKPDFPPAYSDLGGIYKRWGRLDQALDCFDRGLALAPESHFLHTNRGATLEELGRLEEALAEYEVAMKLCPEDLTAKWNTSYLYLRLGVLDRGWEAHDLRLGERGQVSERFPFPRWDGSSLEGKTILVYAEQGLGDEIWLASCIPDLIEIAGHCVIECASRLAPIFARSFPSATVVGGDRLQIGWIVDVPKIDVQVAMGSMPRFLRPTLESFPSSPSYLKADSERVEHWRARLALLGPGLKVGICWRSGLVVGERHKNYSQLTDWGEIFRLTGIQFVNLQYDDCSEELRLVQEKFGVTVTAFSDLDLKNALDDTTALISALDVVVSANTAVSELAGAAGAETYRLDAFGKPMDALGTGQSPWHPTMRLFGQLSPGDWSAPLAMVAEALNEKSLGLARSISYVAVSGSVEVAVTDSLDDLPTYVLKEQGKWFDPEYDFVIELAQAGWRAVDIGADAGAYAVPMAKRASNGKVLALTHTSKHGSLLMASRMRNGLEKNLMVAITETSLSLDDEMDRHGLIDIDFVRLSGEACTVGTLQRSSRFFSAGSPLLMFAVRPGKDFDFAVHSWLQANGYSVYRLVPGPGVLAPLTSLNELDVYAVNLFACKRDRAELLARQGRLVLQPHALSDLPGVDRRDWQAHLAKLPYAAELIGRWSSPHPAAEGWEVYWMSLNLHALSQAAERPAAERLACLQTAANVLVTLVGEHANLPRLLSLCRVMTELGRREAAVGLLNQICALISDGMSCELAEPCLALTDSFSRVSPVPRENDWVVAMILEQRENLRAFSDWFTGGESLTALEEVASLGFGSRQIDRRIALIKAKSLNS